MRILNLIVSFYIIYTPFITNAQLCQNDSTGFVPINDLAGGQFNGMIGGLYGGGSNIQPAMHHLDGINLASQIQPLDLNGNTAPSGHITFISIGMSNCNLFFSDFRDSALTYPLLNPKLKMVNGAVGGKDIDAILDTNNSYWNTVSQRLALAQSSHEQVQAVWFLQAKHINGIPPGQGLAHIDTMERKFLDAFRILKIKFPNLKQIYSSGRDYGGYSVPGAGNPEPYAYYTGWAYRKLVERQINGDPALNYNLPNADVPWLAWSGYIWADGINPRSDGFQWLCPQDFQPDGVHPSASGLSKVTNVLMSFFTNDTTAYWFRSNTTTGSNDILEQENIAQILAAPNPVNDFLILTPAGNRSSVTTITDSFGRVVLRAENENKIFVGSLSGGVYFYHRSDRGKTHSGKFLKL